MKSPGSSLTRIAATMLLAALASPGCASSQTPTPAPKCPPCACGERPGESVNVVVTNEKGKLTVSPDPVYLRAEKDWAQWSSPDGVVYITLKKDSPFPNKPQHDKDKKVLKSDRVGKVHAGKGFDYAIELVLPDKTSVKIDPRIEIMQ